MLLPYAKQSETPAVLFTCVYSIGGCDRKLLKIDDFSLQQSDAKRTMNVPRPNETLLR